MCGQPLAPILRPAPIDGPDVTFRAKFEAEQAGGLKAPGAANVMDRKGRQWVLGTQGRVHVLMAAHSMAQIDRVYASVFEGILGERISTRTSPARVDGADGGRVPRPGGPALDTGGAPDHDDLDPLPPRRRHEVL